jgi:hypothetical protein
LSHDTLGISTSGFHSPVFGSQGRTSSKQTCGNPVRFTISMDLTWQDLRFWCHAG